MLRQIANNVGPHNLIREPAGQIAARLETVWAARSRAAVVRGYPFMASLSARGFGPTRRNVVWDHLIYAYLIENTRCEEIIRRVIYEAAHGERLRVPRNPTTYEWLRSTEELFYSYGPPLLASTAVSQLRPDPRKTRRNAYFRMFGVDLQHGADGGPFPYEKPQVANRDFVPTFENFLRQTWRAIENARNAIGPNPTDSGAIADLALRLQTMLNERRGGSAVAPNLAQTEFGAVAHMSWLHLLLDFDNDVLTDFQAVGTSPEERLARLGERVGVASHAGSHSFFILAPAVSQLLIQIEGGAFSVPAQAEALYLPAPPAANPLRDQALTIIDHWSRVTGRDLKAAPVVPTAASAGPAPVPPAGAAAVSSQRRDAVPAQ
ncbi:hypothetical protein Acsp04_65310 [Actinomadura sp. NBRC 104425]|uniref:hypothetical protein n=1 Tax=Actinomadura sp. NBRC 104425 TaxID=3032204 RepID=UPI0024A014B2|nr:hypothetical protein [Actinomadura sp. NBRC 104425]GLZ16296.1 hypothetical protein Acsp04_65310 [Actinomadura sp. NBRC 104425]